MKAPAMDRHSESPLSAAQVAAVLQELESCVDPQSPTDRPARVCRAQQIFDQLEAQWKAFPNVIQPYLDRLKQARARLADLRRQAANEIADAFADLKRQTAVIEERETLLRAALIELFRESGSCELRTARTIVRVQVRATREVPPPGSEARALLERLLREAGRWDAVSTLSPPKLFKVMEKKWDAPQFAQIESMCPPKKTFAVMARPGGIH